jgi:hypothetical protein
VPSVTHSARDAGVRAALGHVLEHLALASRQVGQRIVGALRRDELAHQVRVDHGAAARDPRERLRELGEVGHPALEQVADRAPAGEQLHRVLDLRVGGEHEDRDVRLLGADRARGVEALGRVRRRHADVDDRQVGPLRAHQRQQLGRVRGLPDDLEAGTLEHAGEPLAQEVVVVRQDHSRHRHDAILTPMQGGARRESPC